MEITIKNCKPGLRWSLARGILEVIEPGAGGHCLGFRYAEGTRDIAEVRHHRLDITVRFE